MWRRRGEAWQTGGRRRQTARNDRGSSRTPTALAAMAPENPATNDVSRKQRGDGSKGRAQVHVLAAGVRAQRSRSSSVGAGERDRPADSPHRDHLQRAAGEAGHDGRREKDAAADDVGEDDRGRVESTEARSRTGGGTAISRRTRQARELPSDRYRRADPVGRAGFAKT